MDSTNENLYNWSQKPPLSISPVPPLPPPPSLTQQHLPMFYDSANISSLGTSSADNESHFTFNNYNNNGGGIINGKIGTGGGISGSSSNYLDSGYSTLYGNTKSSNNMLNSSYLSNSTSSSSLSSSSSSSFIHHHSNILEPIIEDTEMKTFHRFGMDLTPNTRNIAKINAFHITSPISCNKMNNYNNTRNRGSHDSPSPGKRSACMAFRTNFCNKLQTYENDESTQSALIDTTPAKHRKLVLTNCTNLTPKKSTATMLPTSSASASLFQPKLYDIAENPIFVELLSSPPAINCQYKPQSSSILSTVDVADSQNIDHADHNNKMFTTTKIPAATTTTTTTTAAAASENNENLLAKPKRKFERHHSIISTSTPFAPNNCEDQTASVPTDNKRKFNRFRKVQSFSPSKYLKMQHEKNEDIERFRPYKNIVSPLPNWRNEYSEKNIIPEILSPKLPNPAKKFLEFDHEAFDEIINSSKNVVDAKITPPRKKLPGHNANISTSPSSANVIVVGDVDDDDLPRDAKHICDVNASLNLSIIPKTNLDSSVIGDFNENNDINPLPLSINNNQTDSNKSIIFSNYSDNLELPKTPSPPPPILLSANITTDDREIIYKTPTKKNQRSSHSVYDDQKSSLYFSNTSPRQEQNKILYSNLPSTPPKNLSIRKFTQQKSPSTSPTSTQQTTTKNKSPLLKRRTLLFNNNSFQLAGLKRLDIIGHLEGNILAIELILSFLSDKQLVECLTVSKKWKRIIECCPMVAKRMKHYSKFSVISKENVVPPLVNVNNTDNNTATVDCSSGDAVFDLNNFCSRKPFHNVINWKSTTKSTGSRQNSVTTSEAPNISEFQQTQGILQNCGPHARVTKCPRCNRSSIINEKLVNNAEKSLSQSSTTSSQNSITSTNSSSSSTSVTSSSKTNNTQPLTASDKRHLFIRGGVQSHETTMNKTKDYSTLPFQKSSSVCLDFDDFSTTTTNNNDNTFYQLHFKTEPNLYNHNYHHNNSSMLSSSSSLSLSTATAPSFATEYAQCTNNKCGFCFCIKCLCDARHLNGFCTWESHKQQSEEIEDEQELENMLQINEKSQINNNQQRRNNNNNNKEKNSSLSTSTSTKKKSSLNLSSSTFSSSSSYVACSKQSKRNLRRLCSLEN